MATALQPPPCALRFRAVSTAADVAEIGTCPTTARDEFFMKIALAPESGLADPVTLINKQRRQYLNTMRDLSKLAESEDRNNRVSQLLIEGAILHLQADLDWLERCQEELE